MPIPDPEYNFGLTAELLPPENASVVDPIESNLPDSVPEETSSTEIFTQFPNKGPSPSGPTTLTAGSGAPNGTVSVPNEGAKLYVFFYEGDLQKPVYFASTVDY